MGLSWGWTAIGTTQIGGDVWNIQGQLIFDLILHHNLKLSNKNNSSTTYIVIMVREQGLIFLWVRWTLYAMDGVLVQIVTG